MSSSIETIGHKLQSLEERLQAENESHKGIVLTNARGVPTLPMRNTSGHTQHPASASSSTVTAAALAATTASSSSSSSSPSMVSAINTRIISSGGGGSGSGFGGIGSGNGPNAALCTTTSPGIMRQTPRLPLELTRPRQMSLALTSQTPAAASKSETDKTLKMFMSQTGILTIDGHQYPTDIKELEHLGDLGSGTSGNVVQMRHVPTNTILAVKQMRRTGNVEENKRIFMDLDVVLKSHDCAYIVQCLGCFVRESDVWICMELMSMCFDKLLKLSKKPVPEPILGKVTVATVNALSYLKDKHGVIHRDVKPSNILIDKRGNIKLCDFGISGRLVDSKANTRSAGCAAYMAPERIDPKKPKYDIRADVWSLGITLVELATARSPYEGCNTDFEVLTKVLDSEPPCLPRGDGFNFSQDFHNFVNKCLTKNHQDRPKYPELLAQPFIKTYEIAKVDVPKWFREVQSQHTTILPATTTKLALASSSSSYNNKYITTTSSLGGGGGGGGIASLTTLGSGTMGTTKTIKATQIPTYQHHYQQQQQQQPGSIPQHQHYSNHHHYQQQQQQQHHHHHHQQHQQSQQQATQLPQPKLATTTITNTSNYYNSNSNNNNAHVQQFHYGAGVKGGGSGGSGSSSATSSSPLSPPSINSSVHGYQHYHHQQQHQHKTLQQQRSKEEPDAAGITQEMGKLYRNSPFLQRKLNNGGSGNVGGGSMNQTTKQHQQQHYFKYSDESPKKEQSMFSTIGQSILRNLTTSPFSQKKHTLAQANQIDPLWRMPTTQDAFETCNTTMPAIATNASSLVCNSPAMHRKQQQQQQQQQHHQQLRYQTGSGGGSTSIPTTITSPIYGSSFTDQTATTLIPNNRNNEFNIAIQQQQQRPVQGGNHSPIVLQRFYHQQNQLREKEYERQREREQQQQLYARHATPPPSEIYTTTNPFYSNYTPTTTTPSSIDLNNSGSGNNIMLPPAAGCGGSGGGGGGGASSSHSTSSQSSSTQSSCSQVANSYDCQQKQRSPPAAAGHFGVGTTVQLQYQPLPTSTPTPTATTNLRGTNTNGSNSYVHTPTSPPISSPPPPPPPHLEQMVDYTLSSPPTPSTPSSAAISGGVGSKLSKLYARRQLLSGSSSGNATEHSGYGGGGGGGVKDYLSGTGQHYNDAGWFNTLAGAMKRQFATYVKLQLNNSTAASASSTTTTATTTQSSTQQLPTTGGAPFAAAGAAAAITTNGNDILTSAVTPTTTSPYKTTTNGSNKSSYYYHRTLSAGSSSNTSTSNTSNSTSPTAEGNGGGGGVGVGGNGGSSSRLLDFRTDGSGGSGGMGSTSAFLRRYAGSSSSSSAGIGLSNLTTNNSSPNPHILAGLDRRHRSPDPPPRYNRGQSPLLLRKNLLEMSGQTSSGLPGSPLLNRRYISGSPPLPPPRRGSESVPGSPQHFRTRIHYTPEPQRRIYRTIDQ